jgi:hypothetical protein
MNISRGVNFWTISLLGGFSLLRIAGRFWHPPRGFAGWDYFELGLNAAFVLAIWFVYRKHEQDLAKLGGRVDEGALAQLSRNTSAIAIFAYLLSLA